VKDKTQQKTVTQDDAQDWERVRNVCAWLPETSDGWHRHPKRRSLSAFRFRLSAFGAHERRPRLTKKLA